MKFLLCLFCLFSFSALGDEIRVLTWNVFMIPKPINFSKQRVRTPIISEKLLQLNHDIIFLQEAFRLKFQKEISQTLKVTHPFQANLKKGKNILHVLNSGLYIASKFPFKILGKSFYNKCAHADCFASKGVILIEVNLPSGKKIQMATTHMQAWDDQDAKDARKDQIYTIKKLMDENTEDGIPQILVGDLNIDGTLQEEYENSLNILGMTSRALEGQIQTTNGFKVGCYKTPGENDKSQWLDHIWLRNNKSKLKLKEKMALPMIGNLNDQNDCPLSDHHAVEATLVL